MRKIDIDELNEHGKFAVILKCLLAKNNITQWELAEFDSLGKVLE